MKDLKEHEHVNQHESETKPAQDEVAKKAYALYEIGRAHV